MVSIKITQKNQNASYFISFTCHEWLPLIAISSQYDAFSKWFYYLKDKHIPLLAYVIMPNHFHGILHVPDESIININNIIANGKRFIAYEIVKSLKAKGDIVTLSILNSSLSLNDRKKKQQHKVFISSFDCKEILSDEMFFTKLDYIHFNAVRGKWNLAEDYTKYPHSSAGFYELEEENEFLTHFSDVFG